MADDILRMQAEVQDRYSGPLKALRAQLLDTARTGANHSETLAKGFKAVEGTMQSTARTASSVVNPAFAALGVTGLSAGAAVAGISNALNKLTGSMLSLGQLSRETGVAAKTLQEFGSVAGRFGIEQDAVASATKNFAAQMRTFSIGTGEAFRWVMQQGRDASGRKAFQDFATDLQRTSDEGEKLKKALSFMETIKNPVERGIFAQQFFGNQDLGRIADGHLGRVVDLFKKAREKLGEFKPEDIIDAEKFDRSVNSLKGSMQRFGQTIAREVLGPATELTTWADSLVSGQRADVTKSLREGLKEVKKQLAEINWKQFGEDTVAGLQAGTALAGSLASALHQIAETIHNLRSGNYAGAFASADSITGPVLPGREEGADGPLRRRLAPRLGDDEIEARQRVEDLKKLRAAAVEAQGHFIGRTQQRMGLLGTPESYDKDLDAAQAKLRALEGRTPEQRKQEFEASEKLRKALDANTEELKASRNGATVQKQSMDTQGGLFGGATVQTAGFGSGFRRFGGYGGGGSFPGGGSGPGYSGEQGPAGGGAGRSLGGGGRFNGLGGARPSIPPIGPRPSLPGAGTPGRNAPAGDGLYDAIIRAEGTAKKGDPYNEVLGYGQYGRPDRPLTDMTLNEVRDFGLQMRRAQAARGTPWGRTSSASGAFQIVGSTMMDAARGLGLDPATTQFTPDVQRRMAEYIARRQGLGAWEGFKGHPREREIAAEALRTGRLAGTQPPRSATVERADGGDFLPNGTPRLLRPNSMPGAPGLTMDQANALREGKADGNAWAAREAARKTFEAQQAEAAGLRAGGARVAATAARAGVVATPKLEANGSVVVNVLKPGPETRVATTASGKLFQDVVQRSGAQMRRAD